MYTTNGAFNKHDIWKFLSLMSYASPLKSAHPWFFFLIKCFQK